MLAEISRVGQSGSAGPAFPLQSSLFQECNWSGLHWNFEKQYVKQVQMDDKWLLSQLSITQAAFQVFFVLLNKDWISNTEKIPF